MKTYNNLGVAVPTILLPHNIDISTWSVIACDQYTQDGDYWQNVERITNGVPSTYHITYPEIFLNKSDKNKRIESIKNTMQSYIDSAIFDKHECFVYTKRTLDNGDVRKGVVIAIDLDTYDYNPNSNSLIRATEKTIPSRIPPRVAIREGAPIETPHIMLLINDKKNLLFSTLDTIDAPKLYDGTLMLNSGSVAGYKIANNNIDKVINALATIANENTDENGTFLFAAGDGNHSLATAKTVWDNYKKSHNLPADTIPPLRYALVEVVNLYDEALKFQAIHRVLFGCDGADILNYIIKNYSTSELLYSECPTFSKLSDTVLSNKSFIGIAYGNNYYALDTRDKNLVISRLQSVLDAYLLNHVDANIDYIHDDVEVARLVKNGATGILLSPIEKESLFPTINNSGVLPRKSFSLGSASQKRFYTECRALI